MSAIKNKKATQKILQNDRKISFIHLLLVTVFLSGIWLFSNSVVKAQSPVSGGFAGQVTEKGSKTPLPGATVRFTNQGNGFKTAKIADASGYFRQDTLQPGVYEIVVTREGYKTETIIQDLFATRSNQIVPVPVELEKVETVAVNPIPTPTPIASNVGSVTAVKPRTDDGVNLNPRRDALFNDRDVRTFPLGGTTLTRSFDELALLAPGVAPPPQAIGNSVGPGVGGGVGTSGQFAVNGLRSRANNFTVDGSDNNDEDIGVRRQGFFALVPQPIESIQEFQIITLLAPAQFGRNLGAQVNALSKGGGNAFHGTIFGFANADFLNARNFFDSSSGDTTTPLMGNRFVGGVPIPVFVDNQQVNVTNNAGEKDTFSLLQGGFAIGGPIFSNKLFFFASGEGQHLDGTKERNFAVPTVEERGLFGTGAQGLFITSGDGNIPLFPSAINSEAVYSLFPFPNNPNGIYKRNTYTQALSTDARGRILSGRIDYNFHRFNNNPQTFTIRYNNTDDRRNLTDVGGSLFSAIRPLVSTDNFSTYLTGGITDKLSNEFRFSWGRTRLRFEELRDDFLRPITANRFSNSQDTRFLLNVPFLINNTRARCPANDPTPPCFNVIFADQVDYFSSGNTETSRLGLIGQLIIAGFSPVGVDVFNFPQERENNTFQFADTMRRQIRQHNFSFGTDIRSVFLDSDLPRNSRPLVTFNGSVNLANGRFSNPLDLAAAGAATGFFQSLVLPGKDAKINLSYYQFDFFAQDEWRIRPNLNFNFGLRYELNTTPKEAERKIEDTFNTSIPSFLTGLRQFIDGRNSIYDSDRNNFAPRLSFAYSPKSSTVIRGGIGIYYDQILGAVVSQSRNVFPTFSTLNFGGGLLASNPAFGREQFTFFNPLNAIIDPATGRVCNSRDRTQNCDLSRSISLIQPGTLNTFNRNLNQQQIQQVLQDIFNNFPRLSGVPFGATLPTRKLDTPLSYQYSVGVEQKLFKNTFLSVAYVGTIGRGLLRFTTPNLGDNYINVITNFSVDPRCIGATNPPTPPNSIFCEPIALGTTDSPSRPVGDVGSISQFETTGRSRYDSLQIGLRGRLLKNKLQYQASYVYGKVNDDVSDVFDLAGAFALPQNSITKEGEYAPANFDVRHRFTYSFIYALPEFRDRSSFYRDVFGGWQIAGTGKFNTGQPFTVNSIYDINQDGNLTDRLNSTQTITITGNRRQPLTLANNANTFSLLAPIGRDGSVPRNSFRAGSILDLDLSFIKTFVLRESQNLQFRADVFNFINRANFGIPVRFLEAPGFGQATDTVTPGRRIQFAVKYIF